MEITIDSKSLVDAISWVTKDYDGKNDKSYVALTVDSEGFGSLSHTSVASLFRAPVQVLDTELDKSDKTSFALDGNYLKRLSGALSGGPVVLTEENGMLQLNSSVGKFTLPTIKAVVPKLPETLVIGEASEAEYFDTLQRIAKLCDIQNAGAVGAIGVVDLMLDATEGTATMMATDRYTLGEIIVDFTVGDDFAEALEEGQHLLIPAENATMISPSKGSETVEFIYEKDSQKFGYNFSDGRVALFTLKDVPTLNYKKMKNTRDIVENSVIVNTKALQKAIGVISNLDWNSPTINLEFSEESLVVSDDAGANRLEVEVDSSDISGDYKVRFVRTVLNSAFAPISTGKVKLGFKDEGAAFVFDAVLENDEVVENVFVLTVPKIKE